MANKKDSLGDRMKEYEGVTRNFLMRRNPIIIRVDGKAFHTFTKGFKRPFDEVLIQTMWDTTIELCKNIQGAKVGYVQSDEISILITDYEKIETNAWFDNNLMKMCSVSASIATMAFNKNFRINAERFLELNKTNDYTSDWVDELYSKYINKFDSAIFDSRVFQIPKDEVNNYFIWRQQDCTRNAIQMLGQANFSHKELHGCSCNVIQEKLFSEKGLNFNDIETTKKRGACIVKEDFLVGDAKRSRWIVDKEIPIFTQDRDYIEKFV